MEWVCLDDKRVLQQRDGKLCCEQCQKSYPIFKEMPVFASEECACDQESVGSGLGKLWELMQSTSARQAFASFCDLNSCKMDIPGADWKSYLSVPENGCVLEIGAGIGSDTLDLASEASRVIAIVPNQINGLVLQRNLKEERVSNVDIAVMRSVSELPIKDQSVSAIVMEQAAMHGMGLSPERFSTMASEWRRVLAPSGTVLLGLNNSYDRLLGLHYLRSKLLSRTYPSTLNRLVKRMVSGSHSSNFGLREVIRSMSREGFDAPQIYAPLPDPNKIDIIIPVEDKLVVRYFLNNLIRKNSICVRKAIDAANLLVSLKLFRYVVPYYYLIFKLRESANGG